MRVLILFQLLVCTSVLGLNEITITLETKKGPINGRLEHVSIEGKTPLIAKYYGIPYAESTSGRNRFRKPFPKAPFTTPFDATGDTPVMACFQQTILEMNILREKYGVHGFSEDCLSLNIFSPYGWKSNTLMPVMVWFYGGGFRQGAASMYNPEALAVFGNVIVVTVNYRVGMFGFLRDRMGVIPGNQGLWDQRLALEWINENIISFNGNKRDITIFGQSAGAACVLLQALYPGNKGLFTRVIAESGSSLAPWSIKDIDSLEQYLMDVGCQPNTNSTLRCMQSKDPMMLLSNNAIFGPVIDGELLADFPEAIMFGNNPLHVPARTFFSSLDIMIGFNDMDGVLFYNTWASLLKKTSVDFDITQEQYDTIIVPEYVKTKFRLDYTNATRSALAELLTFFYTDWADPSNLLSIRNCIVAMTNDPMFYMPAIQVAKAHSQLKQLKKGNTYFYEFSVQSDRHPLAVPYWLKGSYHADEIPYVFGFPLLANSTLFGNYIGNYTVEEQHISRKTMSFWSNFAKSGNPNKPIPATNPSVIWPRFTVTSQHYFQISNPAFSESVMDMKYFHPRRMAFWSQLVPKMLTLIQTGYL